MHQVWLFDCHRHGNHAALRRAEDGRLAKTQRLECLSCVSRHLSYGVGSGQFLSAVEHVDREIVRQRLIRVRNGACGNHDALHAEAGNYHKRSLALPELEIVHGERVRLDSFNLHVRHQSSGLLSASL